MTKPDFCRTCPMSAARSTGFVPDLVPLAPVAAFVLRMPSKDDLLFGEPMTGRGGRAWEHNFLAPTGLRRDQVIIANVLRCYPSAGEFPTGKLRGDAVRHCQHWDAAVEQFQPNVWGVSIAPGNLLKTPNQEVFLRRAMARVKQFVDEGYRPCLLMGEEAREKYAPWLAGNMKKWQNHWWFEERRAA